MFAWRAIAFKFLKQVIAYKFPGIQWISPAELAQWLENPTKPQPVVLDARSQAEYAVSHLNGSDRIDPDFPGLEKLAGISRSQPIVVYCSIGYRSAAVVKQLEQAGFTQVQNLEGSLFQWVNEGHSVFQGEHLVQGVHPYDPIWGKLLKPQHRTHGHATRTLH